MNQAVMVFRALLLSTLLGPLWALAAGAEVAGYDHWIEGVSGHDGKPAKLYLWEKRLSHLEPGAFMGTRKVVLLTHGATFPGRTVFDLQPASAPGQYSLMDALARRGFDVFALDHQNFGRSEKLPCGLCTTAEVAVRDVDVAVDFIRKYRGVDKVQLLGWSWGAAVDGVFAARHPEKVHRLVLYAPTVWTDKAAAPPSEFRTVTPEMVRAAFEAEATDDIALEAWLSDTSQWGRQAPNGPVADLAARMPLADARRIAVPTLVILGELDRAAPLADANLKPFYEALANPDKRFVVVPGAGHALAVQKPRERLYEEVAAWFSAAGR